MISHLLRRFMTGNCCEIDQSTIFLVGWLIHHFHFLAENYRIIKEIMGSLISSDIDLTEKSKILKEHTLRQFAGWTTGSNMPQKYLHYLVSLSHCRSI